MSTNKAQLSVEVRAVFWKEDGGWRGECIELDASVSEPSFDAAYSGLYNVAYSASYSLLRRGLLPVRRERPSHLCERWTRIINNGGERDIADLKRSDDFNECALRITLKLEERIADADVEPDLGLLRIVLFEGEGAWFAQCLEYDLGGQGATKEEAAEAFFTNLVHRVSIDRMLGRRPLAGVGAAPDDFVQMW